MRARFTAVAVVCVALFLGCPAPLAAGDEVPFKGTLEGDVTITPLAPPFANVFIEGTGKATHLGRFTVVIPHIVNFATSTGVGSMEFTAANGDTLTADFTGQATPAPGGFSIVEIATITGGTGRFEGATGTFTVERFFNTDTLLTTGSFEGTISWPRGKPASLSAAGF